MKINVDQVLKAIDGSVMKDVDAKGAAIDATLKLALVNAVLAPAEAEKMKRYELYKRIKQGGDVELTSEEITLCKEAVDKTYPTPLVVGQVIEMLEKKEEDS